MTKKQQQSVTNKIRRLQNMHKRIEQKLNTDRAALQSKIAEMTDHFSAKNTKYLETCAAHRRAEENAIIAATHAGLPLGAALSIGHPPKTAPKSPPPFSN